MVGGKAANEYRVAVLELMREARFFNCGILMHKMGLTCVAPAFTPRIGAIIPLDNSFIQVAGCTAAFQGVDSFFRGISAEGHCEFVFRSSCG